MRNNNQAVVRKITKRSLMSNRRRNFFLVAAITLTAFMITSVFSVGISWYETLTAAPFRSEGVLVHASLAKNNTPEQLKTLNSLSYVKRATATYRVGLGYLDGFEGSGSMLIAVTGESWRYSQSPAYTNIEGKLAAAENEIMLSRAHLKKMGIDEPYIGMEIPMEFAVGDYETAAMSERRAETFILSAMYTEYISLKPGVFTPIFVSEAFAGRHGRHEPEHTDIRIIYTNQSRAAEYTERLARDLGLDPERGEIVINPMLNLSSDTGSYTMYIAIGVIVTFFMFVGFLLIYNVMYISVSKDVRFYGLLKTMGTTPRQLRRIVNGQVLTMCLTGLPAGLAAAALASFVIIPALDVDSSGLLISFSPVIYILGAAFTLITAYIGASISARKAAKVSPVEAVKYTGAHAVDMKPRVSAKGKPSRMAWRNMFRERKRAFVVLLSLFLGVTVFTSAMTVLNSADIDGSIDYWHDHDIALSSLDTSFGDFGIKGVDREIIAELANLVGVSEVREQTLGIALFDYPREIVEAAQAKSGFFQHLIEITGIDRAHMEELNKKLDAPIDTDAFERGEIALVSESGDARGTEDLINKYFPVGTELDFEIGEQARIPVKTQIAGYTNIITLTGWEVSIASGGLNLIMSNAFLESIGAKGGANHLGINIEEGMEEAVNAAVSEVAEKHGMAMGSALEARRAQEELRVTLFILGSAISGILALIGIFNFVNLISVGLITRKREFAALESVGMSRRQVRLMLRWEGAVYWILTIAASVTAGTGIAYGLFWLIHNQDPSLLPRFVYPILPAAVVFGIITLICTATPELCYRGISRPPLAERLREAE